MTKLIVFHAQYEQSYDLENIREIIHDKYKNCYTKEDILGNGCKEHDSVMIIYFKDGTKASFGSKWKVRFE